VGENVGVDAAGNGDSIAIPLLKFLHGGDGIFERVLAIDAYIGNETHRPESHVVPAQKASCPMQWIPSRRAPPRCRIGVGSRVAELV
jgi:hypothetical protein